MDAKENPTPWSDDALVRARRRGLDSNECFVRVELEGIDALRAFSLVGDEI